MIYLELFLTFLKIGAFTFGGGYAMLPFIQQEVLNHGWLTQSEVLDFIAISESTPGPFAINISTYVGFETAGFLGALCSTTGIVLPSFVIILIIAKLFSAFSENKYVKGALLGLKGAVVGLIGVAVITAVRTALSHVALNAVEIIIAAFLFVGTIVALRKKVHPIVIVLAAALVGVVYKTIVG